MVRAQETNWVYTAPGKKWFTMFGLYGPGKPATPATRVQPEDHRNALYRKAWQKTSVMAMAQVQNVPRVPQVHQSCVRTDLSTVRQLAKIALSPGHC